MCGQNWINRCGGSIRGHGSRWRYFREIRFAGTFKRQSIKPAKYCRSEESRFRYVYIELNPSAEANFEAQYEELVNELKEVYSTTGQLSKTAKEKIQSTLINMLDSVSQTSNMLMELKRLKMKDLYFPGCPDLHTKTKTCCHK